MKVALFLHRFIRRLLLISALFPVMAAYAVPVSNHGYIAELLVSGVGAADGMTVDADGALFITDYQAGRILKVGDAGRKGSHSYTVFADGILFPTDIALGTDGNLYATSSTGGSNSI